MNVNLVAVNADGNDVWLDLYKEQPIKLTFNIEDIVTATPKAEFTRKFRLPATDANYNFFTTAFEINGVDFNPGLKYPARLVIDGADFREGELRLLNVYRNDTKNRVDYECVFIGSTKSLGTELGEKTIGDLDWSDYTQLHDVNEIEDSWLAYPESVSTTAGLFNGNLLFPVVDFGNTYNGTVSNQSRIAVGHPSADGGSFDQSNHPINYTRFKPMVRYREVMRRIFEDHGFTFSGAFLTDTDEVARMYVSAWGNSDDIEIDINPFNENLTQFRSAFAQELPNSGTPFLPILNDVVYDNGNNVSDNITYGITGQIFTGFTAPVNGVYTYTHDYTVRLTIPFNSNGTYTLTLNPPGTANTVIYTISGEPGTGGCAGFSYGSFRVTRQVGAGAPALVDLRCGQQGEFDEVIFEDDIPDTYIFDFTFSEEITSNMTAGEIIDPGTWTANATAQGSSMEAELLANSRITVNVGPGDFAIAPYFENKYKCIDLIKDSFKMFRLVMVPNPDNPTDFLIIPWNNYIGRGELKDWTSKLCVDKDIVIKPLILDQTDRVILGQADDEDYYNTENIAIFGETYGDRQIDSLYDVLEGEREIRTKLASTPASQIEGYDSNWQNIFIPQIHLREAENGEVLFTPTKAKTRLLYYNGLVPNNNRDWYIEDLAGVTHNYTDGVPVVSTNTQIPNGGPNNKALTFERETHFDQSGTVFVNYGQDLYTRFWGKYMRLLYNKDTRRVTAYFVLSADDILNFRYNDVIYVEGVYYYVEKIYDAPLGQKSKVKVDLITLKDYRPAVSIIPQPGNIVWENASSNWETGYTNNWENV